MISNTAKAEAVKRLEAAAHALTAAVEALELLETLEARKHAVEMRGAVEMIERWILEIEEA